MKAEDARKKVCPWKTDCKGSACMAWSFFKEYVVKDEKVIIVTSETDGGCKLIPKGNNLPIWK